MKRWITILGVLLAIQLGLAAFIHFNAGGDFAARDGEALVQADQARVDRIVIEAQRQPALVLEKKDGTWRLPGHYDFPASSDRVQQLLDKLAGLKPRLPVATSGSAAERFKVADADFERKLVLAGGKETFATLYLGDSPGFRRIYARTDGSDAVYEVEFGVHEASVKPDDWADRGFLRVKEEEVTRAELPGITLERKDGQWLAEGLSEGEETVQAEAAAAVGKLAGLTFLSVLGSEARPEYKQDAPVASGALTLKSGEKVNYVFSKPEQGSDYVLKTSAHDYYFKVAGYIVDELKDLKREKLVRAKAQPAAQDTEAGTSAPATQDEPS